MLCFLESLKILSAASRWREEVPFIFDDFHFCRSRVIGLDMTENRIFTLLQISIFKLVLLWARLTKIYPPLLTSVQP
jgi:hypothetical protein